MDIVPHYLRMIRDYDYDTYLHCIRVAGLAYHIGENISLNSKELNQLIISGLLHDLGKIRIDKFILHKPGKLSSQEWDEIYNHSKYGVEMLINEEESLSDQIIDSIYSHHEYYNGQGYPRGISGESIDINARIISIADAFDAMTTNRIYRTHKYSSNEAVKEIMKCSGTQFDPNITKTLTSINKWAVLPWFRET